MPAALTEATTADDTTTLADEGGTAAATNPYATTTSGYKATTRDSALRRAVSRSLPWLSGAIRRRTISQEDTVRGADRGGSRAVHLCV